jgi:ABC-type lipoprotein release transport system permease subunit
LPRPAWRASCARGCRATCTRATGRSRTANFFRAVDIEKRMMFIILALIVLVAAINIISTLVVAVKDKQADIAILRTLGARRAR